MKSRLQPIWLCLILPALSLCWLGSIIHESDQASLILGALRLARGDVSSWLNPGFYEYGNYFLSYWMLAGLFAGFPSADPVFLANIAGLSLFWLGAGLLIFSIKRKAPLARAAAVFAALAAPSVLIHLPYFAPNFVSAGLLFAGAGLLNLSCRFFPASVLLWLLAFGCRSDAFLLLPLLVWLSARQPSFTELFRRRRSWIIVGGGVLIFFTGRALNGFASPLAYSPFFIPKVYAAFLIFGLGGALVLLLVLFYRCIQQGLDSTALDERSFWWAGGAALLIPFVFYSAFMFSTRHWAVLVAGMLLLVCSQHTDKWWPAHPVRGAVLLLCGIIPLVVGIRLPFVTRPSLTWGNPELFPTTDGRCPMGAVVPFMFSDRRLDHNQKIWAASRSVKHWEEVAGEVPLGSFQLFDIVRLAIFMNGQRTNARGDIPEESSVFYLSGRALLKPEVHLDKQQITAFSDRLEDFMAEEVAGEFPVSIVKLRRRATDQAPGWSEYMKRTAFLRQIFQGNEIAWLGAFSGTIPMQEKFRGRPLLLFSVTDFSVSLNQDVIRAEWTPLPGGVAGFFCVKISAFQRENTAISVSHSVWGCTTIYPDYMSLKNL